MTVDVVVDDDGGNIQKYFSSTISENEKERENTKKINRLAYFFFHIVQ